MLNMTLKEELNSMYNDALYNYIVEGCKRMAKKGKSSFVQSWTYNPKDERDSADHQKMYYDLKRIARGLEEEGLIVIIEKETYAKTLNYWLTTDETKIVLEVRW